MSDAAPTAAPEKASFAEDLVDIWFAPAAVFARRAKSGFLAIMVVLTVAFGALYMANRGAMQGIMDAQYRKQEAAMMEGQSGDDAGTVVAGQARSARSSKSSARSSSADPPLRHRPRRLARRQAVQGRRTSATAPAS